MSVEFLLIPRTCNSVAHELARNGLSRDLNQPNVLLDFLPDFVTSLVGHDLARLRVPE